MSVKAKNPRVSFTEYFGVSKTALKKADFFNISLISDLPLFIDPFHLFYSDKPEYKKLHDEIIKYLVFLRQHSIEKNGSALTTGELNAYYRFPEVKQNWLGYAVIGNEGHGLGLKFATELNNNFYKLFRTSPPGHLEKLTLVAEGVGKDSISDFSTNLIHAYLAEVTQAFALKHIDKSKIGRFTIKKAEFDYTTKSWKPKTFSLPKLDNDYVVLTPRDLLTKEDTWINRTDLIDDFAEIPPAVSNQELRLQLINYFNQKLKEHREEKMSKKTGKVSLKVTAKSRKLAARDTIREFPITLDVYIGLKEARGDQAEKISQGYVTETEVFKDEQYDTFVNSIDLNLHKPQTLEEARNRANYFKHCIEEKDLYKNLYKEDGITPASEDWIQRLFWFVWYGTPSAVNREPKNGLGEPDYVASRGAKDQSLIEFKLASSKTLEKNLLNQLEAYKKPNNTKQGIWVILVFTDDEYQKVQLLMQKHDLKVEDYIIVDARKNNKIAPSKRS